MNTTISKNTNENIRVINEELKNFVKEIWNNVLESDLDNDDIDDMINQDRFTYKHSKDVLDSCRNLIAALEEKEEQAELDLEIKRMLSVSREYIEQNAYLCRIREIMATQFASPFIIRAYGITVCELSIYIANSYIQSNEELINILEKVSDMLKKAPKRDKDCQKINMILMDQYTNYGKLKANLDMSRMKLEISSGV